MRKRVAKIDAEVKIGAKNQRPDTLETKKHISNVKIYKDLVSPSLKDAILYLSRYETLTKQDYRYTKKTKDDFAGTPVIAASGFPAFASNATVALSKESAEARAAISTPLGISCPGRIILTSPPLLAVGLIR